MQCTLRRKTDFDQHGQSECCAELKKTTNKVEQGFFSSLSYARRNLGASFYSVSKNFVTVAEA